MELLNVCYFTGNQLITLKINTAQSFQPAFGGDVWMETSENNAAARSRKVAPGNRRDVFLLSSPSVSS